MRELFLTLLHTGLLAGAVALAAAALRWVFRRLKLPAALSCALWCIVLLRMLLPAGMLPRHAATPLRWAAPAVERGVEALSRAPGTPANSAPAPARPQSPAAAPQEEGQRAAAPRQERAPADTLAWVWLAGAAALWAYLAFSYLRLRLRLRAAVRVDGAGGPYWESGRVSSPFVFGLLRPRIYLPPGLEGDTLEYVLRHERRHIKQRDYLVKLLFLAALGLHWYNPALWLAWALMDRDMELACDEAVMKGLRDWGSARGYSAALLSLAAPRRQARLPLGFGESGVGERIRRALRYKRPALWVSAVLAPVLAVLLVWVLFCNPAFAPLPQAPPELTVTLDHREEDAHALRGAATSWGGVTAPSPWPDGTPEGEPLVSGRLSPALLLTFPEDQAPSRVEAVDYVLGDAPQAAPLSFGGLNGVEGQYYATLDPHPDSTGEGMETRMIVLTCTWDNGKDANTCEYAFLVKLPALRPDQALTEPIVVVGDTRLDPDGGSAWAEYGAYLTVTDPQGRSGVMDLGASLRPDGTPVSRIGTTLAQDVSLSSASVPLKPLDEAASGYPDEEQYYTLTYTWDGGGVDTYRFSVAAAALYPELDTEQMRIRCFDPKGQQDWKDLDALLPAPASWAEQTVGGRNGAATLAGLTGRLFAAFTSPQDGWAVAGVGMGAAHADTYVYRTRDGGRTWTETGRPEDAAWYPTRAAFVDDGTALIAIGRFNASPVYRTRDGGESWEKLDLPALGDGWACTDIWAGGRRLTFSSPEGETCTLYAVDTADGELWRAFYPIEDPERIPLEELPWPPHAGAQEEFTPSISNWYEEPIKLLGLSADRTAAVFAFDGELAGVNGLLLCVGGHLSYFPELRWSESTRITSANPVWGDWDGDGADELALSICVGTGTGVSLWDLHVFEPDGAGLSLGASLRAWDLVDTDPAALGASGLPEHAVVGHSIYFSAEEGRLGADLALEDRDGAPTLSYVGGLACGVDYDGERLRLKNFVFSQNTP